MADIFSKKERSKMMSLVKSKNSLIEKRFASLLRKNKIKYRSHSRLLPGKPDFYFNKIKTVIFIDSCFWHGCRRHGSLPKSNKKFWIEKISNNKKRDVKVNKEYKKFGWKVIRMWEHDIKNKKFESKAESILHRLKNLI